MTVTVVDYGAGNLKSVTNMLEGLEYSYVVTNKKEDIDRAEKIIFPGQGHFGQAMECLNARGIAQNLKNAIERGVPFLGVCVGHQLLFESSEEAPGIQGLGVFKGKNARFKEGKVPQIGWNRLKTTPSNSILEDEYVYFVNSYYVVPEDSSIISAYSDYTIDFTAAVEHKNVFGMQFHPEKSGETGRNFVKKWLEL